MPQMSGPELAKRLASARPDMKVLCMSGYTDDSIVRHGVLEAHIAYLQKPITPDTLTTRVREVLTEHRTEARDERDDGHADDQDGPRILVVTMTTRCFAFHARALASKGYRVETAPDGAAAARAIEAASFDVILSDIDMPA